MGETLPCDREPTNERDICSGCKESWHDNRPSPSRLMQEIAFVAREDDKEPVGLGRPSLF